MRLLKYKLNREEAKIITPFLVGWDCDIISQKIMFAHKSVKIYIFWC